jgi:hypothetical protein
MDVLGGTPAAALRRARADGGGPEYRREACFLIRMGRRPSGARPGRRLAFGIGSVGPGARSQLRARLDETLETSVPAARRENRIDAPAAAVREMASTARSGAATTARRRMTT